jgi:hypothetical protein
VSGLQKTRELVGRNNSDISVAFPAHDDYLVIVGHAIEDRGQALPQIRVGRLGHLRLFSLLYRFPVRMQCCRTIPFVSSPPHPRLDRVLNQLELYEHPLLNFSARAKGEGVEIIIEFKDKSVPVHTYYFDLHPRDLDDPQFEWSFQRQLFDALHDYFMEMFIRTPQDRTDRQQRGL